MALLHTECTAQSRSRDLAALCQGDARVDAGRALSDALSIDIQVTGGRVSSHHVFVPFRWAFFIRPVEPLPDSPRDPEATKGSQCGPPEAPVREAVHDGVDAGRGVGQQVDERDGRPRQTVRRALVERLPRVDDEDRGPAEEEEKNDDYEHVDDAFIGHQLLSAGVSGRLR